MSELFNFKANRRQFIKRTAFFAAVAPLANFLGIKVAVAADAAVDYSGWTMLDSKDAMAAALGYGPDAAKTDTKKWPRFQKGQSCANCILYKSVVRKEGKGCAVVCGVFEPQKKLVMDKGWCNSWAENKTPPPATC